MSSHLRSDHLTISLTLPDYPPDSPFALLQSFLLDTEDSQSSSSSSPRKLKLRASPISPLSPLGSTAGSSANSDRFHNQFPYETSALSKSSGESTPRSFNKAAHQYLTNTNDMSIDSPHDICSSSVIRSRSVDCNHAAQLQNYVEGGLGSRMFGNNFAEEYQTRLSHRQSIVKTLRELEDALLGPDDELESDFANLSHAASGTHSDRDLTDQLNDLIFSSFSFNKPGAKSPPEACRLSSSLGGFGHAMPNLVSLPCVTVDPFGIPVPSSNNEPPSPQILLQRTKDPVQLLVLCAEAISLDEIDFAQKVMDKLNQVVSIYGDPMERLAAYMVEGLSARLHSTGKGIYMALKCKDSPNLDMISAMQLMYELCPYFKFGHMAANGAIAEAFKDSKEVHIVDLEIVRGFQWISLIQALGSRPEGPPHLRITGIGDPEAEFSPAGGLQTVGQRLAKFAESVNVPFEFHALPMKLEDLQVSTVDIKQKETLAVNSTLHLHHMPDESLGTLNHRDRILRVIKSWNPKVLTMVEQEANTNTKPFLPRFMEALSYYSAMFESLDVTLPRESRERVNVEQRCIARDIVNIIACEGSDRVERFEVAGKWRARMEMAGLQPYPLSCSLNNTISGLLQSYCPKYTLHEEAGALHLGWSDRTLVVASAWH